MRPGGHDHRIGGFLVHLLGANDLDQFVRRQVSQIIQRLHAFLAQRHQHGRGERLDRRDIVGHAERDALLGEFGVTNQQRLLGTADQFGGNIFVEAFNGREFFGIHVSQFLYSRKTFGDQQAGDDVVDIECLDEQAAAAAELFLPALALLGLGQDVDVPAGQLAGETDVLAAAANGQRQLLVGHDNLHAAGFLVDHHLRHLGRRQRVHHEGGGLRRPGNDVDLLALQLLHHGLHA